MSIVDAIGHTPLVELKRLNQNSKVKIFAKLEGNNPGGSISQYKPVQIHLCQVPAVKQAVRNPG